MSENGPQINALFLKPFSLGWKREVVRRVITRDKTPNCDIYYISPNNKKFRSMNEIRNTLIVGLSPECFTFKKEPLGLEPNLETIRDAKVRGKGVENSKRGLKNAARTENSKQQPLPKQIKTETEEIASKLEPERVQSKTTARTNIVEESAESKPGREKPDGKEENQRKSISNQENEKPESPPRSFRLQSLKRNAVLKKVTSTEETKQSVVNIKNLKKITKRSKRLSKSPNVKRPGLRSKKNISVNLRLGNKKPSKGHLSKGKSEGAKESESNDTDKKARDLKSIVKKNIGKYREMREKQKLGVVKNQMKSPSRKLAASNFSRRKGPISENKSYLKPLEKGWKRELVFRNRCTQGRRQQADVYYLHPSGKKLRSSREISENLTHGLTIDYFTFRKEPIGCGEPSEIIRNARPIKRTD